MIFWMNSCIAFLNLKVAKIIIFAAMTVQVMMSKQNQGRTKIGVGFTINDFTPQAMQNNLNISEFILQLSLRVSWIHHRLKSHGD